MPVELDPSDTSRFAQISFYDYVGYQKIYDTYSDATADIQDFLFYAQRRYFDLKNRNAAFGDNITAPRGIDAYVPFLASISSPLIIPVNVRLVAPFGLRLADDLAVALPLSYAGDPNAKALRNPCLPMLMIPTGASVADIEIYCKNGNDKKCSGIAYGKNWSPTGITITSGGSGYSVGDILKLPQPAQAPYEPTKITVKSVNGTGAITSVEIISTEKGIYSIPSESQKRYWKSIYGYTGPANTVANNNPGNVFDASGNYMSVYNSGAGNGTGATFSLSWPDDFNGNGGEFRRGAGQQGDAVLGSIIVRKAATQKDLKDNGDDEKISNPFGFTAIGLQLYGQLIATEGGYYGIDLQITDGHFDQLQPISADVNLSIRGGLNIQSPNVTIDTWNVTPLLIDDTSGTILTGRIFHNSSPATGNSEYIITGSRATATAQKVSGCVINFDIFASHGTKTDPKAALRLGNIANSIFDINIVNTDRSTGTLVANPINYVLVEDANFDAASMLIRGRYGEGVLGVSKAPPPNCAYSLFDSSRAMEVEPYPATAIDYARSGGKIDNICDSSGNGWAASLGITLLSRQIGPFGDSDAVQWTLAASDFIRQRIPAVDAISNTPIYGEVIVKAGSPAAANLIFGIYAPGTDEHKAAVRFNLSTGENAEYAKIGSGTVVASGVQFFDNGWMKLWMVGKVPVKNPQIALFQHQGDTGSLLVQRVRVAVAPRRYPPKIWEPDLTPQPIAINTDTIIAFAQRDGEILVVDGWAGTRFTDILLVSPDRPPVEIKKDPAPPGTPERLYTYNNTTSKGAIMLKLNAAGYQVRVKRVAGLS